MPMTDVHVVRGRTAKLERVEGDLRVGSNAKVTAENGKAVVVTGGAYFEGAAEIACDFECDSLKVERGKLAVTGDLTVRGNADVAHTLDVDGEIRAKSIDVGGKLSSKKSIFCEGPINVGGLMHVVGDLEAGPVGVGGKVDVSGGVKITDLDVGGKAEVGGGSISGRVRVGGFFASKGPLEFGEVMVYGKCTLPAGCTGQKISTFGKLSVAGALSCRQIKVGGVTEIKGDCSADNVSVNGKLGVSGSMSVSRVLELRGSAEVKGEVNGADLRVGGRFRANKVVLSNEADIVGELETEKGMKAKLVTVGSGSRCKGPVVGERIQLGTSSLTLANWGRTWAGQSIAIRAIGRMTSVEDLYAKEVVLGKNSRCRRVFAEKVEVAEGCTVEQVVYTTELRGPVRRAFFARPAEKMATLPTFPL
jgi:predicted acyltransferase (DUF342 family)